MLIRQDTSPFGLCFGLLLQWRHARFKSTLGHICRQAVWIGGHSGRGITLDIWGSIQTLIDLIKRFQLFPTTAKRDRFKHSKRSLFLVHIMANGDTCPQGTFNAAVVANLRRYYPDRFPTETG